MEKFAGRWYAVYYLDGWKYWTMGDTLMGTILINKCIVKDTKKDIPKKYQNEIEQIKRKQSNMKLSI